MTTFTVFLFLCLAFVVIVEIVEVVSMTAFSLPYVWRYRIWWYGLHRIDWNLNRLLQGTCILTLMILCNVLGMVIHPWFYVCSPLIAIGGVAIFRLHYRWNDTYYWFPLVRSIPFLATLALMTILSGMDVWMILKSIVPEFDQIIRIDIGLLIIGIVCFFIPMGSNRTAYILRTAQDRWLSQISITLSSCMCLVCIATILFRRSLFISPSTTLMTGVIYLLTGACSVAFHTNVKYFGDIVAGPSEALRISTCISLFHCIVGIGFLGF